MDTEISDEQLQDAVAASRSWRGVLRAIGVSSPRVGRALRARCDDLGIDYAHFRQGPPDDVVRSAVASSETWSAALAAAGYAEDSGSARAQLRKRCALLGLSTEHLDQRSAARPEEARDVLRLEHLRQAGALLAAAYLTLAGHRVSWPLEPAPYDLLAEGPSGVQRVQVKTTTSRRDGTWQCGLTRSVYDGASGYCVASPYGVNELDAFAIVDGDLRVYLVPFALLQGRASLYVSLYAAFELRPPGRCDEAGVR